MAGIAYTKHPSFDVLTDFDTMFTLKIAADSLWRRKRRSPEHQTRARKTTAREIKVGVASTSCHQPIRNETVPSMCISTEAMLRVAWQAAIWVGILR